MSTSKNLENTKKFVKVMDTKGFNIELLVVTEILGLRSLHYGYWDKDEKPSFDNIKEAQKKYTETLLSLIPEGVKNILDIGSGIGDNAQEMARRGYFVTSMSPDKNHKKFFDEFNNDKIRFENCTLADFKSDKVFDLFLLSESQTYFDPKITFEKAQTNLKEGGYILVSDMFNKVDSVHIHGVTHTEEQYLEEAKKYGLEIVKSIDITEEIIPSLELANSLYVKFLLPLIGVGSTYLENTMPFKYKLINIFFKKRIRNLKRIIDYYKDRLDPKFFSDNIKYKRVLLRKVK